MYLLFTVGSTAVNLGPMPTNTSAKSNTISDCFPNWVPHMFHLTTPPPHLSWYDLPSPSPPTSSCLQPHLHPLHLFCLCSTPTPMHTCTTCTTMLHPLSD